ncbi:hypothetical protein D3C71_1500950 [compost metagenome]
MEDQVQRRLQLREHHRGADEQQQQAPQAGQRAQVRLRGGIGDDGLRDLRHALPGQGGDLVDQRLLGGRIQRGGQPQQQDQQRRQRQQGVERQRSGLGHHIGFDEAPYQRGGQALLQLVETGAQGIDGRAALHAVDIAFEMGVMRTL